MSILEKPLNDFSDILSVSDNDLRWTNLPATLLSLDLSETFNQLVIHDDCAFFPLLRDDSAQEMIESSKKQRKSISLDMKLQVLLCLKAGDWQPDANYEEDSRGWFGRFKRAEQEFPEEDVQQLLESHSESLSNDDLKELVELYTRGEPTVVDEVELKTDSSARDMFEEKSVIEFQPFICGSYPKVAETAIHALFPFVPTYRCESAFLTPLKMKTKQ
ncbi:Zinc finger BED domain-containing protein [Trichinella spiralis]|uniref:Zinc finger BED domain-containing protein n=1 Tax=Trichinella spiralis TaxID=6334 RepID=A0ABR3K2T5_TRISP